MIKVRATDKYEKLNVQDREYKKIFKEGEEFEVTEERFIELSETNDYHEKFVERVIVEDEVEIDESDIIDENEVDKKDVTDVKAEKVKIVKNKNLKKAKK